MHFECKVIAIDLISAVRSLCVGHSLFSARFLEKMCSLEYEIRMSKKHIFVVMRCLLLELASLQIS